MLDERASSIRPQPGGSGAPDLTRVRLLADSADLLLGQLRLHAKRVRALAAAFGRETRRLTAGASPELARIEAGLESIAARITAALTATDAAFTATFAGIDAMEHLGRTVDIEHPDRTPSERLALQAQTLLRELRGRHTMAQTALREVAEGLVVHANNLAIVIGQPGSQALDQMRVVIRQMRHLSQVTADLGSRLDVFVQNQGAALQDFIPAEPLVDAVLTALRPREGAA